MPSQISNLVKWAGCLLILISATEPAYSGTPSVVGKISFARGSVAAQQAGESPRILGKDGDVFRGDNIQTSERSFVVIEFNDGAKVTVRPNSNFSIDQYDSQTTQPSAQLSLHEGGVRAESGDIAKHSTENFQIKTDIGTVKAQQADYSVRVCKQDCEQEAAAKEDVPVKSDQTIVARLADIKGQVFAKNYAEPTAQERALSLGSPLYHQDQLRSQTDSYALLVFRDGEKITLQAESKLDIAQYHFQQAGVKDNAVYRLTTGGMRVLTGSIGKANKDAYTIETPVGTIGIRGTGFDLACVGDCIAESAKVNTKRQATDKLPEGLYSHVWQGQIALTNESGEHLITMPDSRYTANLQSQTLVFPNLPDALFETIAPRPDRPAIDIEKLFGAQAHKNSPAGLYVTVHKGHVQLVKNTTVNLSKGEAAYASHQHQATRLTEQPSFQTQDNYTTSKARDEQQELSDKPSLLRDMDDKKDDGDCQAP